MDGLLVDSQIEELCNQGFLISSDFDPRLLKGCTYEFRAGEFAYTYDYEKKITRQQRGEKHVLNPFETLTIITIEEVNIDKNHFLMLFSKGSLFSLGLTPVFTAADPGFTGRLGITMTNLSIRPIEIEKGVSIVKGCFFQLSKKSSKPYTGQHGDARMTWPYPSQFHLEPSDFSKFESQHWKSLPPPIRSAFVRIKGIEKYIQFFVIIFFILILGNIAIFFLRNNISNEAFITFNQIIGTISSIAEICGFFLALFLTFRKKD